MAEVVERLKDLSGIISSLLVLADEKFSILPLNPVIHEQLWPVAAILGLVAGFGTRQFAKNTGRLFLGAICLGLAFLTVILILILVRAGSGHGVSLGARVAYLSFFLFIGGAVGGFWRSQTPGTAERKA